MVAFVTDFSDHSKIAVTTFLSKLLSEYGENARNVYFWSDGPSSQFKNRFMVAFMKLCRRQYHLESISWNYFASAHGKGAIDGVGGTLKRFVTNKMRSRALLVRDAHEFAEATIGTAVNVKHMTEATIKSSYRKIRDELESAVEIPISSPSITSSSTRLDFERQSFLSEFRLVVICKLAIGLL